LAHGEHQTLNGDVHPQPTVDAVISASAQREAAPCETAAVRDHDHHAYGKVVNMDELVLRGQAQSTMDQRLRNGRVL
jgi:hypothetical protein